MPRYVRSSALVGLALATLGCEGQLESPTDDAHHLDTGRIENDAYVPPNVDAALDAFAFDAPLLDAGALDTGALGSDAPSTTLDAPTRTRTFTASDAILYNPERGLYRAVNLLAETTLEWLREEHPEDSVVYSYVRLDDFRDRAISAAFLTRIENALNLVRRSNYSLVLRFAYNEGPYPASEPDAPLSRIRSHLDQLRPILQPADDVISVVQAGFIGAWGEWHTSTNGLDTNAAARRSVAEAVLAAIPPTRATQIRYPAYVGDLVGAPLDAARAWNGSFESRIGFHNDCFLASATDLGTYPDSGAGYTRWHTYLAQHTAYVPVGGETCAVYPARSACAPAMAEMAAHHYSFINRDYHPDVVSGWAAGGCLDHIERRLGYRFVMTEADLPEQIKPGGSFQFRAVIRNDGWAAPFNARPLVVRLRSGSTVHEVALSAFDVRHFMGGETNTITAHLRLPASLAAGSYTVSIGLPSSAMAVRTNPAYAIRFANTTGWNATLGENEIGSVTVSTTAPGSADASATSLAVIP
jgi:hypothetical protein